MKETLDRITFELAMGNRKSIVQLLKELATANDKFEVCANTIWEFAAMTEEQLKWKLKEIHDQLIEAL